MPRKPQPVAPEVAVRLKKAQELVDDAEEAWKLALAQRRDIVMEALDVHGASQVSVAQVLGVVKGRIHGIILGPAGAEE